jgi:hypothetical protein
MQGGTIRRAAAVGAGLALALGCAGTAQARLTPPGTAAAKTCSTQAAGYGPLAGTAGAWVFYGDLNMRLCISRGTGGWFWASARLDSPANSSRFDRFTGGWTVRLQGCSTRSGTTIESAVHNWDTSYDVASLSGSRYLFSEVYTPNHADTYGSYRVWAHSVAAAVVPRSITSFTYSLSPNGFYSGTEDFYGPCTRA